MEEAINDTTTGSSSSSSTSSSSSSSSSTETSSSSSSSSTSSDTPSPASPAQAASGNGAGPDTGSNTAVNKDGVNNAKGADASAADLAAASTPGHNVPGYKTAPAIDIPKGYQLKIKPPRVIPKEEEGYWAEFFGQRRGENCSGSKVLTYELQKVGINENGVQIDIPGQPGSRIGTGKFGWVQQWGFGPTAYLFDFFDPALRPLHIDEFKKIWDKFSKYAKEDNDLYKDPFSLDLKIPDNLDPMLKQKLLDRKSKMSQSKDEAVYKISVNAVQLNLGMKENRWHEDNSVVDNAKSFIKRFDMNSDGRLSPRELILGSIFYNKGLLGSDDCTLCYEDLVDKLDGIFAYLDCDNDGLISSEDLFKHLPKMRRETNKWNFFALASKAKIRTAVTNDFILKNGFTVQGKVSKTEFRMGVLLGFWDRQTDNFRIVEDDSINLRAIRWQDDDVVDVGAMTYIRNKAEAEAELKRRQRMQDELKTPEVQVTMARGPGLR